MYWSAIGRYLAAGANNCGRRQRGRRLVRRAVAIAGDYAIVGAYDEDENATGGDTQAAAGSAYIFKRMSNGVWQQVQKSMVASDRGGDEFGSSVAIWATTP